MTRALVLGGGGVVGINWEVGVLTGLAESGFDLTGPALSGGPAPDIILGTSAGSMVGSLMTHKTTSELQALAMSDDANSVVAEAMPMLDFTLLAQCFERWRFIDGTNPSECAEIGAFALQANTVSEERWVGAMMESTGSVWHDARFQCTAVNASTGEFMIFDQASGVEVGRAVAASCSVPGIFPPVTAKVQGTTARYTDGGVRSGTSIDLVAQHDRILVLAPIGSAVGDSLDESAAMSIKKETAYAEGCGSSVITLMTDAETNAATFISPLTRMDPDARRPALEHGIRQGRMLAKQLNGWW
jgi:NTE family protein